MGNNLYFEVGIKDATDSLNAIKQKLDKFVNTYQEKMQIKIQIENLEAFVNTLKSIGNGDQLKPLINQIDTLQRRLASMSDKGQYLDNLRAEAAAAEKVVEIYKAQYEAIKKTNNTTLVSAAKNRYEESQKDLVAATTRLSSAEERFAKEAKQSGAAAAQSADDIKKLANTTSETHSKLEVLTNDLSRLVKKFNELKGNSNVNISIGNDFEKWAKEINSVTESVRQLTNEFRKFINANTPQTLDEAIHKLSRLKAELVSLTGSPADTKLDIFKSLESAAKINPALIIEPWKHAFGETSPIKDWITNFAKSLSVPDLNDKAQFTYQSQTAIKNIMQSFLETGKTIDQLKDKYSEFKQTVETLNTGKGVSKDMQEAINYIDRLFQKTLELKNIQDKQNEINVQQAVVDRLKKQTEVTEKATKAQQELNQVESKQATQSNLFDSQKILTLQEAVDKVIGEINRLQQAFARLGENNSLGNLTTIFNKIKEDTEALSSITHKNEQSLKNEEKAADSTKKQMEGLASKKKSVTEAERQQTKANEQNSATLKQEGEQASKTAKEIEKVGNSAKKSAEASKKAEKSQSGNVDNLSIKYQTLIQRIENWQANLSKLLKGGGSKYFNAQLNDAIDQYGRLLKSAELGSTFDTTGEHYKTLKALLTNLGVTYANVNKEAKEFNKEQERSANAAWKSHLKGNAEAIKVQASEYKTMQKNARDARNEAEKLVSTREKLLRSQAEGLSKILSGGKDRLDVYQYEQVREALRAIREELRQIEAAKQRGGLSTGALLSLGSGANDYSGVINAYSKFIHGKQEAAASNSRLTATEQQLAAAINHSSQEMKGQSQVMSDLKMLATQYLGVWGAQSFLQNIIQIGGQLEMQRLSIGAILGDMAKASELFDRIKNLAIKSPFGVVELDQMTKQLSAYGFQYPELFDMTKRLADISAATGTSVDRLALALGHVRSEAALSGYTLRQFSMANIPLAKKLSEHLSQVEGKLVSIAEVRKRVRKKEIGYEDVLQVLKDLTNEGGMFYNAQEIMSESVKARFKNLKDSMDIMYNEIAESKVGDGLKDIAKVLTVLTRHWQEAGAVILSVSASWIINKTAMMASNKAMVQGNLILGRFTAAQLEMAAQTGNLTRAQLLQAVATKKLAVADAEAAGAVFLLSKAQLQHVANTGKVTAALNIATVATSKYTVSQLRAMAVTKNMGAGATFLAYFRRGWIGVFTAIEGAASAALSFTKAMWPMLALSAIVELVMKWKQENESFAESANYVGQAARNMMQDIDKTLVTVTKNGKPVDTDSLREAVSVMRNLLQENEFYTAAQQQEVDNAKSLSQKYDILLRQMKEMRKEAEWQTNNEGLIEKILKNTGRNVRENTTSVFNSQTGEYETVTSRTLGTRFFNDSLSENMDQVSKSNADLNNAISLLSEYQNVMQTAIRENNNFGLSLDGKSWQEQIKLLAESDQWDNFIGSVKNAGSRFENTAENVKEASNKVRDNWDEIVNDDLKAIMLTLQKELHTDEEGVKSWAKNNQYWVKFMADGIAKALKLSEDNIEKFMKFFYSLFGLEYKGKSQKKEPTEYEQQTELGKQILGNVIRYNKNNGKNGQGVLSVKDVNKITGTGDEVKTESEVIKSIKEQAQKDLQTMTDVEKIYGKTSARYAKAKKAYEHSLNIAQANGISEDEIKTGKYKDKKDKKSKDDELAKTLREKVRILKEAADSYKYWKKAVGEGGAFSHVNDEFGSILGEQGFKIEDAKNLEVTLTELREKYIKIYDASGKKRPKLLEAIKEIDKELAQLGRFDFEQKVEKFVSQMTDELDKLSRSFEIYNSIREATGDTALAQRLTGISPGATPADLKRYNVSSFAGAAIDFDSVLSMSDEEIERYVESLGVAEEKIKAIQNGLKDWKKAEQEVYKSDIQNYAKWLGSLVDLESIRMRNQEEYNRILEETNRLLSQGVITQEEAERRRNAAATSRDTKNWQATTMYTSLYNNSQAMAEGEFYAAYNREMANLYDQMKAGTITISDYADKVEKLNKIAAEFKMQGFLGIKGGAGAYLSGGYQGLIDYHWNKAREKREQNDIEGAEKEEKTAESMMKAQRSAEQLAKTFNDLSSGADLVANMFDALGMEGAATAFGDAAGVLGGIGQGAQSLSALGPWGMAAGGILGGITSIAQLNDKNHERRIQELKREVTKIDNTLNTIKSLRERELGYDRGTLRSQLASLYKAQERTISLFGNEMSLTPAQSGMVEYYGRYSGGNGYSQEYNALVETRKKYMEMYDEENAKKKKSQEALEEYKVKIAELDEEIMYFVQDLEKDLWSIDIQGWASQISDALWTAFENGEDAVKAFGDTAKDIVSSVAKKMMTLSIIEPMFKRLQSDLFGNYDAINNRYTGNAIKYDSNGNIDMQASEQPVLETLGRYFGKGGELEKAADASETFYKWVEKITGMDLSSDESKSGASSSIKNITESTADLLCAYLNAVRLDVSVVRAIQGEYFPLFLQAILASNTSLTNIENNTAAIMRSNDIIANKIKAIDDRFRGLENKTWKLPIA